MKEEKIKLKVSDDDPGVAYLYLPKHSKKLIYGIVKKQERLSSIVKGYKGPDIFLDFDKDDVLIGIEILE